MKFLKKILLSVISMIATTNSISYSMDDQIRNINNNRNESNITDYQHDTNNLTNQSEITINNSIKEILDIMVDYSNNSFEMQKHYSNNFKITLQNQLIRISEINITTCELLYKYWSNNHDNYVLTLSNIDKNNTSINNIKKRMEVIEKKLRIQYDTNKETIDNSSNHNVINNTISTTNNNLINLFTSIKKISNIEILQIDKYKSIQDSLNKFKFEPRNNFLSDVIELAKNYYVILENNIRKNNILINAIQEIAKNLYEKFEVLYLKIYNLKECINLSKNESEQLSNKTKKHSKEMKNLQERFYKITNRLHKEIDINKESKIYITNTDIELQKNMEKKRKELYKQGKIKETKELDERVSKAKESIKVGYMKIVDSIFKLNNNYNFKSKPYIIQILNNMKSMLFNTHNINFDNGKFLNAKIDEIKLLIHYNNIIPLYNEMRTPNSNIISSLNTVSDYSKSIKSIQENLCNIEDYLSIKSTITKKYEKVKCKNLDLQSENRTLKNDNKNLHLEKRQLIDSNKNLHLEKEQLISKNKKLHISNTELFNKLSADEQQNNIDLLSRSPLIAASTPIMNVDINNFNGTETEKTKNNKYLNRKKNIENNENEVNYRNKNNKNKKIIADSDSEE